MKHYTCPLILVSSLVLAACGGTGTTGATTSNSTASTTPTLASASALSNVTQVIEYYGDSTIWGFTPETGGRAAMPAPAVFAQTLSAAGFNYEVHNEGVSGTTACELLSGTDGKHPAWSIQMAASRANYVLVNFAINDEWADDLNGYKGCLRVLAQTAKQNGKQMIFETPNPIKDRGKAGLDAYVNAMKAVAAEQQVPVIDEYQYLVNYLNGQSPDTICPDGLHPTQAIYAMKGKYAANAFMGLFPNLSNS